MATEAHVTMAMASMAVARFRSVSEAGLRRFDNKSVIEHEQEKEVVDDAEVPELEEWVTG